MSVKDLVILGTSSQQPTRSRSHGGYLFRWNEEGLLFDPGEGIQRQFIFANIAPPVVSRIFISHFHGDHCLGFGSMLMRLNLDKVSHPIHCYYPANGKKYFDRLRYGTIYHENIKVIEHPIEYPGGIIHEDSSFTIEAKFLDHGVENIGWRVSEKDSIRFNKEALQMFGIGGPSVKILETQGFLEIKGKKVYLSEVSSVKTGDAVAVIIDTRPCQEAIDLAHNAKLLLCESTYLSSEHDLAVRHKHMTAMEAAFLAKEAHVQTLVLTHFSARYPNNCEFEEESRPIFPNSFAAHDLQRFDFRDKRN